MLGEKRKRITRTSLDAAKIEARRLIFSKRVEGVGFFHLEDRKYRMHKFAASFPGRIDQINAHEIEAVQPDFLVRPARSDLRLSVGESQFKEWVRLGYFVSWV